MLRDLVRSLSTEVVAQKPDKEAGCVTVLGTLSEKARENSVEAKGRLDAAGIGPLAAQMDVLPTGW